jgi:hypothetical protein
MSRLAICKMPNQSHNDMTRFESAMLDSHNVLNKKVDEGFQKLDAKVDKLNVALLGCIEDATPGLIAKVDSHDGFLQQMKSERKAFIAVFVAAMITLLVTGVGAAVWAGVKVGMAK